MIVTESNLDKCVEYLYRTDVLKNILKEIEDINQNLEKFGHKDKQICLKYFEKENLYKFVYKNNERSSVSIELYDFDQIGTITTFMKYFIEDFVEKD